MSSDRNYTPPEPLNHQTTSSDLETIETLLSDNQRLALLHVALDQQLTIALQDLRYLSAAASKIKSDKEGEIREVYEKSVRMESEVRLVAEMAGELGVVQSDVGKFCVERNELNAKLEEVTREMAGLSGNKEASAVRMEIDALRKEVQIGRASVEYEKKVCASNIEQGKAVEKSMISMSQEIERLKAELAEADKKTSAAATNTPGTVYPTGLANLDMGYGAKAYPHQMLMEKYCPENEVQKMEAELLGLKVIGTDIVPYTQRFQDMIPNETRVIERYICGLPQPTKDNVLSSKPTSMHDAIKMSHTLMDHVVQDLGENFGGTKRKWNEKYNDMNMNNYNHNKHARVFNEGMVSTSNNAKDLPFCGKCGRHHNDKCQPRAHAKPLNQRGPGSQGGLGKEVVCFGCGEKGHYKNKCPKGNHDKGNQIKVTQNQARGNGNRNRKNNGQENRNGSQNRNEGVERVYASCGEVVVQDNNVTGIKDEN